MVKLLLAGLSIVLPFAPLNQTHDDFTTFETASYFNDAFGELNEYSINEVSFDSNTGFFYSDDNEGGNFNYYAFPLNYDIDFINMNANLYYLNDLFVFYLVGVNGEEPIFEVDIVNYVGVETILTYTRHSFDSMTTYINNEKGTEVVSDIIGTIGSMVTGILAGVGTGVVGMFTSLFMDGSNISSLGIFVIVLLGLSIALGAVAWVSTLIRGKQR